MFCPRKSNGAPDWKDDAPKDYLLNLAMRRGLPYPDALRVAAKMKREQLDRERPALPRTPAAHQRALRIAARVRKEQRRG